MNYRFFSLGLLVFLVISAEAQALTCGLCGETIRGKYIEYHSNTKNLIVCLDCNQKMPHCDACKFPFLPAQVVLYRGDTLCCDCLKQAKFCVMCGNRISGEYFTLKNSKEVYCQACYNTYPRCSVCGKPTRPQFFDRTTGTCIQCAKALPRCASCSKPITGEYFRFQFADGVYCADCMKNCAKCYTCGVPVKNHYWKFQDGRVICDRCNQRAVIDPQQVRKIMQEVEQLVIRLLGLKVTQPYTVHVEQQYNGSSLNIGSVKMESSSTSPLNGSELGLYKRLGNQSDIYLLYGLPQEMIYETAAHEYAHAWQAENCPLNQSAELREGFAQWVATEILRYKGFKVALEKLEARSDVPYGVGYQKIKQINQNLGKAQLIDYVKKAR